MKIKFPNPFGFEKNSTEEIEDLHNRYGFSEDYKQFLIQQNGFDGYKFSNSNEKNEFLVPSDNKEKLYQDFQLLYGITSTQDYSNLTEANKDDFTTYFFYIGNDLGGNPFVEVLHGKYKGYIGALDHEMRSGSRTVNDFIHEINAYFDDPEALSDYDKLMSKDLGFIEFHADSFNSFIANCLFYQSFEDGDEPEILIGYSL